MLEVLKEQADRFDGDLPLLKELKKGYDQLLVCIEKDNQCVIRFINTCLNPTREQKAYVPKTILDICAAEGISVQVTNQNFISRRMAEPRNWSMSIVDDVARLAKRHGYASEFKR